MEQSKEITAIGQICKALDQMQESLAENLKDTGVSVGRFLITAKTAIQTHGDKDGLEQADRASLYLAIQKAAGDGLMPDGREAALVVYNTKQKDGSWKKTVNYQPMVQGLVKLARNSGEIESIGAYIVYSGDKFSYRAGIDDVPQHDADWFGDRGDPIGVWAFIKLKSGEYLDPVMLTKERIDRIATRSKIAKNYSIKEGKDWEEFWKKAAIRNVLKYAPRSTALDKTLEEDNNEFDMSSDNIYTPATDPTPAIEKPKKETRAAAKVKAHSKAKDEAKPEEPKDNPYDQGETIEGKATEVKEGSDEEIPV